MKPRIQSLDMQFVDKKEESEEPIERIKCDNVVIGGRTATTMVIPGRIAIAITVKQITMIAVQHHQKDEYR